MPGAEYSINWPSFTVWKRRVGEAQIQLITEEVRLVAIRNLSNSRYSRGVLRLSMYGKVSSTPTGYEGRVGSNLKYAASVEHGAARHIIRPRAISYGGGLYGGGPLRGGHLHFFWIKRGYWVRTRSVRHPGQRGKHFIGNALLSVAKRRNFAVILH